MLRIEKEIERGDHYKFIDFPYFALKNKDYKIYQYEDGLKFFSPSLLGNPNTLWTGK